MSPSSIHARPIRLTHPRATTTIERDDVYFAFASGRLTYDCVTCNAKCCRGFGYLATVGNELQSQLRLRPSLPLFVEPTAGRDPQQYRIENCAPGCFFLSDGGLCDIHARYGYDAKPETCRLFPFNDLRRVGKYLVVCPHPSLCPLEVAPGGCISPHSEHAKLLDAMASPGIAARVPECVPSHGEPDTVIELERRVVELAERFDVRAGYLAFVHEQLRLEELAGGGWERHAVPNAQTTVEMARALGATGADGAPGDPALVRTMVAMTPFLRSRLLFRDPSAAHVPSLDRTRVPLAVLSLYLFAETARACGMQRVTFQTISKLAHDLDALAQLLANADAVMMWQRGAPIDPAAFEGSELRMAFIKLAKALLPAAQRRRRAPLGDLLLDHAPQDCLTRLLFLKVVATHLVGRLVPLQCERTPAYVARPTARLLTAVRRWALANVDERVLHAAYEQR
jgi:Fe-S-cluster containining protein